MYRFVCMRVYLLNILILISLGSQRLNVTFNLILDNYGGRHSITRIGDDNLLFIAYCSDSFDTGNAVGIIHCNDIYCNNRTKHYIDTDEANTTETFDIFMRISSATKYPQFIYSFATPKNKGKYHLRFVTCSNYDCTNYTFINMYNFTNNGDNSYVYFIYNDKSLPLISYNDDPHGLYLIECLNIECKNNQINGPYLIDNNNTKGTGWYNSMSLYFNYLLFVYYDNVQSIKYSYFDYKNNQYNNVSHGILINNIYHYQQSNNIAMASWPTVSYTNIESLSQFSLFYAHITNTINGEYYIYANCTVINNNLDNIQCDQSVIDQDKNITNDNIEGGIYPDIVIDSTFNNGFPFISYLYDVDRLKFAQCNNMKCDKPYIQELSSGKVGYGRDSYIAWDNQNQIMFVSFLDYDGNGDEKRLRLLVCGIV